LSSIVRGRCYWLVVCAGLSGGFVVDSIDLSAVHAEEPKVEESAPVAWEQPGPMPENSEQTPARWARKGRIGSQLTPKSWDVAGVRREALVAFPKKRKEPSPVIFAFHGHGGTARFSAWKFDFHKLWPEAICVYPQGLRTPVPRIDPEGKMSGWQKFLGDQNDRDLAFFDVMLASLKQDRQVDPQRIYVAGHSNGGFFTYLLWATRGDQLAAIAPVAAMNGLRDEARQKPLPVLHVAGEKDQIVPFSFQLGTLQRLRQRNECAIEGRSLDAERTEYASQVGATVITMLHTGGHEIPANAPARIVDFFQQHKKIPESSQP